ncbi:MAG TPA: M28 family peptidase [Gemmatimonadaceae bacterium]|nr:M28 family peptidase [Gemmatimonadaceae bacterium]
MKRIGLKPGGDSGYFQHVPMVVRNGHAAALPNIAAFDSVPAGQRRMAVNVIGIIPGYRGFLDRVARRDAAPADSVVVIEAFYGHLGIDRPASDDSADRSADVDASGAAAVLELARVIQGDEPHRYTIVFLVTTGDEDGQAGTTWYVAHPFASIGLTVASLGFEMIGRSDSRAGGPGRAWITNDSRSTMGELFRHDRLPFIPDPRSCQQVFAPGDRAFGAAGIPAHTISSFELPPNRGAPSDSATLDFMHMAAVIDAGVHAVRMLADDPPPTWLPGGRPGMPNSKPDSLCSGAGPGRPDTVGRVRDSDRTRGR